MEIQQRIVAVVADVSVAGPAPVAAGGEAVAGVLIHLPRDAVALQPFRIGRPVVAGFGVRDYRTAARAVVADVAGPHVVAVRIGRALHGAVVRVADRERVGQRVVERQVGARHVRHRRRAFRRHPLIAFAAVERLLRGVPVVRRAFEEGFAEIGDLRAVREHVARAVALAPDRAAIAQEHRARIAEAAHAAQHAEVVVERTVFLHQDDDVLDVLDRARAIVRGNRERTANAVGQRSSKRAGAGQAQKIAAVQSSHR